MDLSSAIGIMEEDYEPVIDKNSRTEIREQQFQATQNALDGSCLIRNMKIPDSIIDLLTEMSMFRTLSFETCASKMTIDKDGSTVRYPSQEYAYGTYTVATTDASFSTGIHRYEVLNVSSECGGCRYIGYVSDEGEIRYDLGMHACDYWTGW